MSAIVSAYKNLKSKTLLLKITGGFCMLFFCLGCVCCVPGFILDQCKVKFEMVIRLYGGVDDLKVLGKKVARENELFNKTIAMVNKVYEPAQAIDSKVTLFDVICHMNPRINNILNSCWLARSLFLQEVKSDYMKQLWNQYIDNGGNYHVIVYGIIEYLCTLYDPTCTKIDEYLDSFNSQGALYLECIEHKTEALR